MILSQDEALEYAQLEGVPDVLLTDVNLEGDMTGLVLIAKLQLLAAEECWCSINLFRMIITVEEVVGVELGVLAV